MNEDRITGQRAGIRWAIAWLHKHAGTRESPLRRDAIKNAAKMLAVAAKGLRTQKPAEPGDRVSYCDDGKLDEVVVTNPRFFHLERMDDNRFWMRIDRVDGTAAVIWISARGVVSGTVEED